LGGGQQARRAGVWRCGWREHRDMPRSMHPGRSARNGGVALARIVHAGNPAGFGRPAAADCSRLLCTQLLWPPLRSLRLQSQYNIPRTVRGHPLRGLPSSRRSGLRSSTASSSSSSRSGVRSGITRPSAVRRSCAVRLATPSRPCRRLSPHPPALPAPPGPRKTPPTPRSRWARPRLSWAWLAASRPWSSRGHGTSFLRAPQCCRWAATSRSLA
jgi:hypothetical protein